MDSGLSNKSNTFFKYVQNNMVLLTKSIAMAEIVIDDNLIHENTRNSIGEEKVYDTLEMDLSTATFGDCDDYKNFIDDNDISKREIENLICKL